MTAPLARATFAPFVGTTFRLDGTQAFTAELVELTDAAATPGWEGFSLFFAAPADAPAPQGIYRVAHDDMGPVELFLVPIGRDDERLLLEAVINRRADDSEVS